METSMDIIDLILIDHKTLKSCIETLIDNSINKRRKLQTARTFLALLKKHSEAEKKSLYYPLLDNKELKAPILEGQIEHGIVDAKVKTLLPKILNVRTLSSELVAELKVLAEVVNHHIKEEESVLLPKVRSSLSQEELLILAAAFNKWRQFSIKEINEPPLLKDELQNWMATEAQTSKSYAQKIVQTIKDLAA